MKSLLALGRQMLAVKMSSEMNWKHHLQKYPKLIQDLPDIQPEIEGNPNTDNEKNKK